MGTGVFSQLGLNADPSASVGMTACVLGDGASTLLGGVGFDVGAELEVDVEGLLDAGVLHAEPV